MLDGFNSQGLSYDPHFTNHYNFVSRYEVWKPFDAQVDYAHHKNQVSNSLKKGNTVKASKVFVDLNTTSHRYTSYTSFMRHSSIQEICMASHSIVETVSLEPMQQQFRKQNRNGFPKGQRLNTGKQCEERRFSINKTPKNNRRRSRHVTQGKSTNKSKIKRMTGLSLSKVKVRSLIQDGGHIVQKSSSFKGPVPRGYNFLKGTEEHAYKKLSIAEKTLEKMLVYITPVSNDKLKQFYKLFFNGQKRKREYQRHSGIQVILAPKKYQDGWMVLEFQGEWPLDTELQTYHKIGNTLSQIQDKPFLHSFKSQPKIIKRIISDTCTSLLLLQEQKIVHGNLRSSSILINTTLKHTVKSVKLFGSDLWFQFSEFQSRLRVMDTPYWAPEVLNFRLFQEKQDFDRGMLNFMEVYNQDKSWLFDMWTLGMIMLELVLGFPLYSDCQLIILNGVQFQPVFRKENTLKQILQRQMDIIFSLDSVLGQKSTAVCQDPQVKHLLKAMLNINPSKRLSPRDVVWFLTP